MCRAVLSKCSYEILALIPWWCDGQRDLSFPVSPFNAVFKAVRREGIEGGLVTGLWFSSPQKLLASSAVSTSCWVQPIPTPSAAPGSWCLQR